MAHNQRTIVTNIYQDFVTNKQIDFFQEQMYRGLIHWPRQGTLTEGEGSVQLTFSLK